MPHEVELKQFELKDPVWHPAEKTKPGAEVDLCVTAKDLQPGQTLVFEAHDQNGLIVELASEPDGPAYKAKKWKVPNTFDAAKKLHFYAVVREVPSATNGHVTVRKRLKSPDLEVDGYAVTIDTGGTDKAFVPGTENLQVKFTVRNRGTVVKKARIEIWGEKYPTNEPVYTTTIDIVGDDTTWTWNGTANAGALDTKPITPEFTPYRVRVIAGPDQDTVENASDPAKGKRRVAIAEHSFEVTFESVLVRIQANIQPGTQTTLDDLLKIEPRQPNGTFAAQGRLPAERPDDHTIEQGRIRIPCVRFALENDPLDQDGPNLGDGYMEGGGATKHATDVAIYTRPELPIELVAKLKSRDSNNNRHPNFGTFKAEAVGVPLFDAHVDDVYPLHEYSSRIPLGADVHQTYWYGAAHLIKDGTHDSPVKNGNNPVFAYWQQRFKIQNDGTRDLTTERAYVVQANAADTELTIYLNRGKLSREANEFEETSTTQIKLAKDLTKQDDIVWVIRKPRTNPTVVVAEWVAYPPGDNCHYHYGGIRGQTAIANESRSRLLRDRYTGVAPTPEPILGMDANAFPYTTKIELDPDTAGVNAERVVTKADDTAGATLGLAGIVFSPSVIGGDAYAVEGKLRACPYERSLGFVENKLTPGASGAEKPWCVGRTGTMTVWRVCTIETSLKLPDVPGGPAGNPQGLSPGVGVTDPLVGGRQNPGEGLNMDVARFNTLSEDAFNEWKVPVPGAPTRAGDPHVDLNVTTYRNTNNNNLNATLGAGHVNLAGNANVDNYFVRYDHYRVKLPSGIPNNRKRAVSNAINALARGTSPTNASAAADGAINALNPGDPDPPLAGGAAISISGKTPDDYSEWVEGKVDDAAYLLLDTLIPRVNPPRKMKVVRWANYYQDVWNDGTPGAMNSEDLGTAGFMRGDSQSYFSAAPGAGNPDTFEHEMGHSLNLAHFSAGNFAWKHHDVDYRSCIMGYNNKVNDIPKPGGAVGNWPHGGNAIRINTGPRNLFCAKCQMKMRGWKEDVLPCKWTHPDIY